MNISWTETENYISGKTDTFKFSENIYAFDLDHTIIKPASGKRFSTNVDDWCFYSDNVINKIREKSLTHCIIIISNQLGINKNKISAKDLKQKIQNIIDQLNVPILFLASILDNEYRKPRTKLWNTFIKNYDKNNSYYCGDAGGASERVIYDTNIKKDFSDSDYKFALNLDINFVHRDKFLFDHDCKNTITYINFKDIKKGNYKVPYLSEKQELLINVGYAGSGKSYYTKKYLNKYEIVNQDTLKTLTQCKKACNNFLKEGKSVVIDNTNTSFKKRKEFIDMANKYKVPVRCFHFTTDKELAIHNNYYRFYNQSNHNCKLVPKVAYNMYNKYFDAPSIDEGFTEIKEIDFTLEDNDTMYTKYYF